MKESLLDNITVYNWKSLDWYSPPDDHNVLEDSNIKYKPDLDNIL